MFFIFISLFDEPNFVSKFSCEATKAMCFFARGRMIKESGISFGLNLCRAISKFNFHFRNKLVSLEIRQAKETGRGGRVNTEEGEQNTISVS